MHRGPVRRHCGSWKVPQVHRQDRASAGGQRRRQKMAVVRIRQRQLLHVNFAAFHLRLRQGAVHQLDREKQAFPRCPARFDQIADPFLVDVRGPSGSDDQVDPELDEQVSELKGVEQVGVEHDGRRRSWPVKGHIFARDPPCQPRAPLRLHALVPLVREAPRHRPAGYADECRRGGTAARPHPFAGARGWREMPRMLAASSGVTSASSASTVTPSAVESLSSKSARAGKAEVGSANASSVPSPRTRRISARVAVRSAAAPRAPLGRSAGGMECRTGDWIGMKPLYSYLEHLEDIRRGWGVRSGQRWLLAYSRMP